MKSNIIWPFFQMIVLLSWNGLVALRIILLEPGFLSLKVIDDVVQNNDPSLSIEYPFQSPVTSSSRGCAAYDDTAANILGQYYYHQTADYVGETYIVALECENVADMAAVYGEEWSFPVITSAWTTSSRAVHTARRIDYRSLAIDPFYHAVEYFLEAYKLYSVAVICQQDEEEPRLYTLCEESSRLFSKVILVKKIYISPNSTTAGFEAIVDKLFLSARDDAIVGRGLVQAINMLLLLLILPVRLQRDFLVNAAKTSLWDGSYAILCTNIENAPLADLLSDFTPTENEDQAPPLPVFVVHVIFSDQYVDNMEELRQYRANLTKQANLTGDFDFLELRELFTLQKVVTLIGEIKMANSSLNSSRTADLLPLLVGAEPTISEVIFDKVMPDTSLQSFASFSPTASDAYVTLFDSSIFDSWWPNDNFPPDDIPACISCPKEIMDESLLAVIVIPVIFFLTPLIYFLVRRHQAKNAQTGNTGENAAATESLEYVSWQIREDELTPFGRHGGAASKSVMSIHSHHTQASHHIQNTQHSKEAMRYKQVVVWAAMRELTYHYVPDATQIDYIMKVKSLTHPNIATFYGLLIPADLTATSMAIVMEYCSKGSLFDLIVEEQGRFNPALVSVLIKDIVAGMGCLHQSLLGCHGSLKSTNCLITSRFNVKITDYYIRATPIMPPPLATDESAYSKMLWTAPETLRGPLIRLRKGTKEGDVYSFAIIMQEITMQSEPFKLPENEHQETTDMSPKQLVHAVIEQRGEDAFRPKLLAKYCASEVQQLIKRCWAETPLERPTFKIISDYVDHLPGFNQGNSYLDYVLKRMEQYSATLEARVAETTEGLLEEKKKSDDLLAQMMPRSVLEKMQQGQVVLPEAFEFVTLGFTAVIDFAQIAYSSTPLQIVVFLNALYSMFDNALENYDLYKVETIQDSYVLASGLPTRNGNEHSRQVSLVALQMLHDIKKVRIEHIRNTVIEMKIGIHTGMCAAGVIGLKAPRYCIFGDTVNTTSRMCSTGEAQRTQISEVTKNFLENHYPGEFLIRARGTIEVKGKGQMNTYYLDARPS